MFFTILIINTTINVRFKQEKQIKHHLINTIIVLFYMINETNSATATSFSCNHNVDSKIVKNAIVNFIDLLWNK